MLDLEGLKAKLSPTPLATFLLIYCKAEDACYTDYMEGAKALYKYLSPIEFPAVPDTFFPRNIPAILVGYELLELEKIMTPMKEGDSLSTWLARRDNTAKCILYSMVTEVLPKLTEK